MFKGIVCAAMAGLVVFGAAQERNFQWTIELFSGRAIPDFLGSEDPRTARGIGIGFVSKTHPKLKLFNDQPELILFGYYHHSSSNGASNKPPNATDAYGFLNLLRFGVGPRRGGSQLFYEIGTGMQFFDQETVDQSSTFSFSPTIGIGVSMKGETSELVISARLLHLSNAGLKGNNQGSNQLMFVAGLRF